MIDYNIKLYNIKSSGIVDVIIKSSDVGLGGGISPYGGSVPGM